MEDRSDLEAILFAGLPRQEADHVRAVIRQADARLLARKRAAAVPADVRHVDLTDVDADDESDEQSSFVGGG